VALAKAEGDLPEAIKRCNEYLKVFQGDTSAVSSKRRMMMKTQGGGDGNILCACWLEGVSRVGNF